MVSVRRAGDIGAGEAFLLAFVVLFPLGPRFETQLGNIYLATLATLIWLTGWTVFVFAGPRDGLSMATGPQRALLTYGGFLVVQLLLHLGGLLEKPAALFRGVQLLAYMALFATISSLRLDRRSVRRILHASLVVLAAECALAWWMRDVARHGFLAGTFDDEHNSFAAYALLMACVLFGSIALKSRSRSRLLLGGLFLLVLASLVFSFSRTAYLAGPVAILAIIHRRWGHRALLRSAFALGVLLSLLGLAIPASVRDRFTSILQIAGGGSDISFMTRIALWHAALDELVRTGFLGVGPFGFTRFDNYYVTSLAETGPVGLLLFLWLVVALLRWLARVYRDEIDPSLRALALGLYGATVGLFVVTNMAADMFHVHRVMGLYWVLAGSLMAARSSSGSVELPAVKRLRLP